MYETRCQSRFSARCWMLGAGALGRPRGMVWGGRREEGLLKKKKKRKKKKGHIIYYVTILGRATGQYNSHFDIDPEDHKRPGRPKDKIPWILVNINFIAPIRLSSLKAKTIGFPFFCHPYSTLNSTDTADFHINLFLSVHILPNNSRFLHKRKKK